MTTKAKTKEQAYNALYAQYAAASRVQETGQLPYDKCSGYYSGLLEAYNLAMIIIADLDLDLDIDAED